MIFIGNNLRIVKHALDLATAELHTQMATYPNVSEYEGEIEGIKAEQAEIRTLLNRVRAELRGNDE